ncbi:MAG: response regulator with CheY-like receiver domain and winged-helix DNA-binding domain [Frankiales bacterium]|nr:response regulator with CheY-like receiver domain and winged-helix DNA-binding domain [Frankiales bacterium]
MAGLAGQAHQVSAASAARSQSGPVVARPIFIVDDDADSRSMIGACLLALGLTNPSVGLASGNEARMALRRCVDVDAATLPVLVVLDRQMPGSSGIDLLRWMRTTPALRDLPVVMLSGDDDAAGVTHAYELGVRSYLVKPVGFDVLASVVRDLGLPWQLT